MQGTPTGTWGSKQVLRGSDLWRVGPSSKGRSTVRGTSYNHLRWTTNLRRGVTGRQEPGTCYGVRRSGRVRTSMSRSSRGSVTHSWSESVGVQEFWTSGSNLRRERSKSTPSELFLTLLVTSSRSHRGESVPVQSPLSPSPDVHLTFVLGKSGKVDTPMTQRLSTCLSERVGRSYL